MNTEFLNHQQYQQQTENPGNHRATSQQRVHGGLFPPHLAHPQRPVIKATTWQCHGDDHLGKQQKTQTSNRIQHQKVVISEKLLLTGCITYIYILYIISYFAYLYDDVCSMIVDC